MSIVFAFLVLFSNLCLQVVDGVATSGLVVRIGTSILERAAGKDKMLLLCWDAFFVPNLRLDVFLERIGGKEQMLLVSRDVLVRDFVHVFVSDVRSLHMQSDGLAFAEALAARNEAGLRYHVRVQEEGSTDQETHEH